MTTVRDVTRSNKETARAFLVAHTETSLFLLSNLEAQGPRLGDGLNSGNYRWIEQGGKVVSVFSLTRQGNLLAETGGRDDLADEILRACEVEPMPIEGVIGEWTAAASLWKRLCENSRFKPTFASKEVLYRLVLPPNAASPARQARVRRLAASDFEQWESLNTGYLTELGLPPKRAREQRRASFSRQAADGHWWGLIEGSALVAIAGLNATYQRVGQVGGVYTVPEERRKGLAREVMLALQRDAVGRHGLRKLVLFTDERTLAARRLYQSLGFSEIGYFGLLFGSCQ